MKRLLCSLILVFLVSAGMGGISAYPEQKSWTGSGDTLQWHEAENWTPASAPGSTSEAEIDSEGIDVTITQTFEAESITLAGVYSSSLTAQDFVYGTVAPESSLDSAILVRKGGRLILKGPGVITLRGSYTDSEQSLSPQPSLLFWVE